MKRINIGFTLAEVLVVLSILGVVAAVTMPLLKHVRPNQEQIMLKKAYYLIGRNVTEMVNDDDFYLDTGDEATAGFANTKEVEYHGKKYGSEEAENEKAFQKFCELFATRMNLKDNIDCSASITKEKMKKGLIPEGHFVSADGMVWILPISKFDTPQSIFIDVNGDKSPNCFSTYSNLGEDYVCNSTTAPDRFEIIVDKYGKLTVPDADKVSKWYLKRTDTSKSYSEIIDDELKKQGKTDPSELK